MAYRDDLAAAQARNDELRSELEEARRRIEDLEREKAAPPSPSPRADIVRAPRMLAGRVYYDPPRTYFPLLHLLRVAAVAAWRSQPKLKRAPYTDNLALVLGYHLLLRPFVNWLWRPLYVALLALVVLPWAGLVAVAGTAALLPVVALARLRIGDEPPSTGGLGWPQGDSGERGGALALWLLLTLTMPPVLPVFIPLLMAAEDRDADST
jgi:hypothetical protein